MITGASRERDRPIQRTKQVLERIVDLGEESVRHGRESFGTDVGARCRGTREEILETGELVDDPGERVDALRVEGDDFVFDVADEVTCEVVGYISTTRR